MFPKIRPAFVLTIALSLFNGCWWDTNSTADAPTVSGLAVSPSQVAKTGEASKITGSIGINTDNATVSYKVTNTSGDVTGKFTIGSIPGSISGSTALAGTILATSAVDGSYTLTITVTDADGQVASQPIGFTVGTPVEPTPVKWLTSVQNVGGLGNNDFGSFISIEDDYIYAIGDGSAKAHAGTVDFMFTTSPKASSNLLLLSPAQAKADGLYAFTGWSSVNSTKIFATNKASASFTTIESIKAEILANTGAGGSAPVTEGGVYVCEFNGKYGVISVAGIDDAGAGDVAIQIKWAK